MKISIVIAVLDSPEVVRRQILHFKKMDLPDDIEIIIVDDCSKQSLKHLYENYWDQLKNFSIYTTDHKTKWTQPTARNFGVKHAIGEYIIVTDIDHIISKRLINTVRRFPHDVLRFRRQVAVLDEWGNVTQKDSELRRYGLLKKWKKRIPPHSNSFAIKRDLYLKCGGVSERYCGTGRYPNREEIPLKRKLHQMRERGEIVIWDKDERPIIYMIPNGRYCGDKDYNPFGLFHSLSRKNNKDRKRERLIGKK